MNTALKNIIKYQILIIDDEPNILNSLQREISFWGEDKNIEVITFRFPIDALKYLQEHHNQVFLVISDLRMPVMKGSDLLRTIHSLYPDISLYLLTAYGDITEIQKAISAEIQQLITKPWENAELISNIETSMAQYLQKKETAQSRKIVDFNMKQAAEFQKELLTHQPIDSDKIFVDAIYKPLEGINCGGDYYEITEINDNRQMFILADVSGHGVRPAFITAMLKVLCSGIRTKFFKEEVDTAEIVSHINNELFASLRKIQNIIVSFSIVLMDHAKSTIEVTNAGHPFCYLVRNGKTMELQQPGAALGFQPDYQYMSSQTELKSGDQLVMFTDGLIESSENRQLMNLETVKKTLSLVNLTENPAQTVMDALLGIQKEGRLRDDVTIITVKKY